MLTVTFRTDNQAFEHNIQQHAALCLQEYVVKQLLNGFSSGPILDGNGNKVGRFELTDSST